MVVPGVAEYPKKKTFTNASGLEITEFFSHPFLARDLAEIFAEGRKTITVLSFSLYQRGDDNMLTKIATMTMEPLHIPQTEIRIAAEEVAEGFHMTRASFPKPELVQKSVMKLRSITVTTE